MYIFCGVIAFVVVLSWGVYNYDTISDPSYYLRKAETMQERIDNGEFSEYRLDSAKLNVEIYKDLYNKEIKKKEDFKTAQKILFFTTIL